MTRPEQVEDLAQPRFSRARTRLPRVSRYRSNTMQRDYILRLIEQVGQLLSRVVRQRDGNVPQEALQSIMAACERLFGLEAVQIFQFTPDQHVVMLAEGEEPEAAHDKILMYAQLNQQAGLCYASLGQPKLARQSFINALRLSLKARQQYPGFDSPTFAPEPAELLRLLGDTPLDPETTELIVAAGLKRS
jgi:hypothetical protein